MRKLEPPIRPAATSRLFANTPIHPVLDKQPTSIRRSSSKLILEQINEEDEESIQHEEDNYESVYININRNKEKLDEFQIGIEGGNEKPKIYFSKKILEKVSLHKYNF